MNRITIILALLAVVTLCFWFRSEHSDHTVIGSASPKQSPAFSSSIQPTSRLATEDPSVTKEDAEKTNGLLEARLFASPVIQSLLNDYKIEEKTRVQYISAKRSRGKRVVVMIPVLSSKRRDEIRGSISKLLPAAFKELTKLEYDSMNAALMKWFDFGTSDRVIEVDAFNNAEHLSGRWLEVEDSSKIKDEFQYVDYGKITAHGRLPWDRLSDRYGNLFSIQEETAAE